MSSVYRVADWLTGGGRKRDVSCLPRRSRSPKGWWERADVYWEHTIFDARHQWVTVPNNRFSSAVQHYPSGEGRTRRGELKSGGIRLLDDDEPLARRAAGLLKLAGVMTVEQLQALLPAVGDRFLKRFCGAGLAEVAKHHTPGMPFPHVRAIRARESAALRGLCGRLTLEGDAPTAFCGVNPRGRLVGRGHVRHQCLAVEMMLRCLEASEAWAGWLPEGVCTPDRFTPAGHPARSETHADRADGCLIRPDGARLFIEIEASAGRSVQVAEKVQRWCHLFDSGPFGGLVLFVAAPKPVGQAPARAVRHMKSVVAEHVSEAAAPFVLVGCWQDWFPDHGQVSGDLPGLRAAVLDDGEWCEVNAADRDVRWPAAGEGWRLLAELPKLGPTPEWAGKALPAV